MSGLPLLAPDLAPDEIRTLAADLARIMASHHEVQLGTQLFQQDWGERVVAWTTGDLVHVCFDIKELYCRVVDPQNHECCGELVVEPPFDVLLGLTGLRPFVLPSSFLLPLLAEQVCDAHSDNSKGWRKRPGRDYVTLPLKDLEPCF